MDELPARWFANYVKDTRFNRTSLGAVKSRGTQPERLAITSPTLTFFRLIPVPHGSMEDHHTPGPCVLQSWSGIFDWSTGDDVRRLNRTLPKRN
ncbi:hypothetical protein RUM44_008463 [Polyplax serrata]|uniref:Uncharacterized protein n=1 Tax=Polyplax serrata TaxID=468196 RepID=A0ABR1BCE5_POLSC